MSIYKRFLIVLTLLLPQAVIASTVQSSDYYLKYQDEFKIHVREKSLDNNKNNHVIVLVNSLSIPALDAFDVPHYSLMDRLAANGFDVWGVDFIGQGSSSFPLSMQQTPPPPGLLPLRAADAVLQLNQVIDFISQKTGSKDITLLGWSWGSIVSAMYAIENPTKVNRLILYGAMYSGLLPEKEQALFVKPYASSNGAFNSNLGAYQNIPWDVIKSHWSMMINGNTTIASQEAFNQVGKTYRTIDKHPIQVGTLRRPMGPMYDLFLIWSNYPIYNIDRITSPTLVIYGEQDIFADKNLFSKLVNVKIKKEVEIEEATHWLIYEKNRFEFYDEIISFIRACKK